MNKKVLLSVVAVAFVVFAIALINNHKPNVSSNSLNNSSVCTINSPCDEKDKLEIYLFHGTQRCPTCIAIGKLTGETINERFSNDVKSGLVEFREINIDLPENKALAEKFQASGSVLFFNSIKNGADNIQDDANVWGLTGNPEEFKSYIAKKVNTLLGREI